MSVKSHLGTQPVWGQQDQGVAGGLAGVVWKTRNSVKFVNIQGNLVLTSKEI